MAKEISSTKKDYSLTSFCNYTLLKIFSYQDGEDLDNSQLACRRFGDIISSNKKYLKKKYTCEVELTTEIVGFTFARKKWFSGWIRQYIPAIMGEITVPFPSLKESLQYSLSRFARYSNISLFRCEVKNLHFGEVQTIVFFWITRILVEEKSRVLKYHSDVFSEDIVTLAKYTGCREYSIGHLESSKPNFKNITAPIFVIVNTVRLIDIFVLIEGWIEGKRAITSITFNHNNFTFIWNVFLEKFKITKHPRTQTNRYVAQIDEIHIGRNIDKSELKVHFTPYGFQGKMYCQMFLVSL